MYFISFDSFDMRAIKYIWYCTVYFRPFRHEIKHKKIELILFFYLKSPPVSYPPTVYLFQPGLTHVVHGLLAWIYTHPSYVQNSQNVR